MVAGQRIVEGRWVDFEEKLAGMNKESVQLLNCDFDLVQYSNDLLDSSSIVRRTDRGEEHFSVNGKIISNWV